MGAEVDGILIEQDATDSRGSTAAAPSAELDISEELDKVSTLKGSSRLIFFSPSELLFVEPVTLEALIVLIPTSSNSICFLIASILTCRSIFFLPASFDFSA